MERFVYTLGVTTEDDVIEHILKRLNTDFANCALDVVAFCRLPDGKYDALMVKLVLEKMLVTGIVKISTGSGQSDTAIEITAVGIQMYKKGGWKEYLNRRQIDRYEKIISYRKRQLSEEKEKAEERSNRKLEVYAAWVGAITGVIALFLSIYTIRLPNSATGTTEVNEEVKILKQQIDHLMKSLPERANGLDTIAVRDSAATPHP